MKLRRVLGVWLLAASAVSGQTPAAPVLGAGATSDGGLKPGEHRQYALDLQQGEFVYLVVEQKGLDVALEWRDPGGATLAHVDSYNGIRGFERIAAVATASGRYHADISTTSNAPDGRYAVAVKAIRVPTAADLEHVAAEALMSTAEALRRDAGADKRRRAAVTYREAAAGFRRLGFDSEQVLALYSAGAVELRAGEARAAIVDMTDALPVARTAGDPLLGSILNVLGGGYDIRGEPDRAMTAYREALAIARARGDRDLESAATNNIGKLYADTSDWQRALESYREVLPVVRAQHNARIEGVLLHNIGVCYDHLGEFEQALDYFGQALVQQRAAKDKTSEADTLSSIGSAETRRGELQKALAVYDQALVLRREVGDKRSEGITLADLGRTYVAAAQPDRAREPLEQALALHRAAGDRRNVALTQGTLASAQSALHDDAGAMESARDAMATFREIGDTANAAGMLFVIARSERNLGRLDDATRDAESSLQAIEELRGRVSGTDLRASYFAREHEAFAFYIDLLMRRHDHDPAAGFDRRALESSERARARSLLENLAESGAQIAKGADPALAERERRIGQQLTAKADRLMRFAGRTPQPPEAVALDREIRELQSEYDDVRAALRKASPAYSALTQPRPLDAPAMQRLLDADTVMLQYALGSDASYLWVVDRDRIASVRLPPEDEIVEAVRDVHDRVTGPRSVAGARALRGAITRLSAMVLPTDLPAAGKRLVIVPDGALEYVPFAMLTMRPAGAAAAVRLVARSEIVTIPSASALASQRTLLAGRPRAPKGIAVLADPVFDGKDARASTSASVGPTGAEKVADAEVRALVHVPAAPGGTIGSIPRLPFTQREAASIVRAGGAAEHLEAIGFDATKDLVLNGSVRDYRYVHFATHGYVDADRPALSAIVLSLVDRDGRPRDGFLRAHELYNLDLSADLVVLSACETGLGRQVRGEGIVGLTRGFMYAGASRVVVSLWSVSDRATAALMTTFYEEMLQRGKTPAAALRAAQLAMMKRPGWENPYYWAGFIIEGDWR